MNPYLFVAGSPEPGTTLLQWTLDNHPDLAVANDTHFLPHTIKGIAGDPLSELDYERSAKTAVRLRDWRENASSRRRRPHTAGKGGA